MRRSHVGWLAKQQHHARHARTQPYEGVIIHSIIFWCFNAALSACIAACGIAQQRMPEAIAQSCFRIFHFCQARAQVSLQFHLHVRAGGAQLRMCAWDGISKFACLVGSCTVLVHCGCMCIWAGETELFPHSYTACIQTALTMICSPVLGSSTSAVPVVFICWLCLSVATS